MDERSGDRCLRGLRAIALLGLAANAIGLAVGVVDLVPLIDAGVHGGWLPVLAFALAKHLVWLLLSAALLIGSWGLLIRARWSRLLCLGALLLDLALKGVDRALVIANEIVNWSEFFVVTHLTTPWTLMVAAGQLAVVLYLSSAPVKALMCRSHRLP